MAKRDRGELGDLAEPVHRERELDEFLPKIEEWVDRSYGKIRADVCYDKLSPTHQPENLKPQPGGSGRGDRAHPVALSGRHVC